MVAPIGALPVAVSAQTEQAALRKPCAHPEQRRSNNWPKGVSGNPQGRALGMARTTAQLARRDELAAALATEFPDATAFELALIGTAADMLERSEHKASNGQSVRMAGTALRIIDRIRDARRTRPAKALALTVEEYFAK
jgi:hypothetical protein